MGRDVVRLADAERVLDQWASTPLEAVMMAHEVAAAEMAAIRTAIATSDWAALEAYGGLNPAFRRASVLNAACAGNRRSRAAITSGRTWRSNPGAGLTPAGRDVHEVVPAVGIVRMA